MTGTAMTVANNGGGVVSIDLANINFDLASAAAKRVAARSGGSSYAKLFPGSGIYFVKGKFYIGDMDNNVVVEELVLNAYHYTEVWKRAVEDGDKTYNKFSKPARVLLGEVLCDMEELEDHEDVDGNGNPAWKYTLVVPCRDVSSSEVNHLWVNSKSGVNSMSSFIAEVIDEMRSRPGQLPLVKLGSKTASRDAEVEATDARGKTILDKVTGSVKMVKRRQTWDIPTFEVVNWVTATPADLGSDASKAADVDHSSDVGAATVSARAPEPAPASAQVKARKKAN